MAVTVETTLRDWVRGNITVGETGLQGTHLQPTHALQYNKNLNLPPQTLAINHILGMHILALVMGTSPILQI